MKFKTTKSIVLATFLAYSIFIGTLFVKRNFDVTKFINIGSRFAKADKLSYPAYVIPNSDGYDGQFYYRLALNPFDNQATSFGISLHCPFIVRRIVYPLTVYFLSLTNASVVPYLMIIVNLASLMLIGYYGSLYLKFLHKNVLLALLFPLSAGFLFVISRDLTEIMAMMFLMGAIVNYLYKKDILATFFLTLAVLTNETTLIFALGFLIYAIVTYKRDKHNFSSLAFSLIPILSYLIWYVFLVGNVGGVTNIVAQNNIGTVFSGISQFLQKIPSRPYILKRTYLVELGYALVFVVATFYSLRSSKSPTFIKISWFLSLIFVLSLTSSVWVDDFAFMRSLLELNILGLMVLLGSNKKIFNSIYAVHMLVWGYIFFDAVRHRFSFF